MLSRTPWVWNNKRPLLLDPRPCFPGSNCKGQFLRRLTESRQELGIEGGKNRTYLAPLSQFLSRNSYARTFLPSLRTDQTCLLKKRPSRALESTRNALHVI